MNYIGHKATAILMFPLIVFPIQNLNFDNINNEIIYNGVELLKNISIEFINLTNSHPIIFISSIIAYWIGSTLIDFIDFKIIRRLIKPENRKYPYLYHRQWTHGFLDNLILLIITIYYINTNIYIFIPLMYMLGVWTHLIVDMLSGSIPIFFYGHYAKSMTRIGINRIIPKGFQDFFSKKLPKIYDKISPILIGIGIFLFFYYDGNEKIILPLLNFF
jgi:hypothetical protein